MRTKWILIESQITGRFGHYSNYIKSILSIVDCERVYVPSNCDLDEPLFRKSLTPFKPRWFKGKAIAKACSVLYQAKMSLKRLSEVQSIISQLENDKHILFWLTVDDFEVISFLMVKVPENISLFGISHMKMQSRYAKLVLIILRCAKILCYSRKTLGCNTKDIAKNFQGIAGDCLNVTVVPYPYSQPNCRELLGDAPQYITYLGDARSEKGFCLILDCLENLVQKSKLFIQCYMNSGLSSKPEEEDLVTRLGEMRHQTVTDERIHWCDGILSDVEYCQVLGSSKIILLPYLASRYEGRVSGILGEALIHGVPVIVSAGTWLADQVEAYGGGVVMKEYTAQELIGAVDIILAEEKIFRSAARKAGEAFFAVNNPIKLKEVIINSFDF